MLSPQVRTFLKGRFPCRPIDRESETTSLQPPKNFLLLLSVISKKGQLAEFLRADALLFLRLHVISSGLLNFLALAYFRNADIPPGITWSPLLLLDPYRD